jgi:hypothetical protein
LALALLTVLAASTAAAQPTGATDADKKVAMDGYKAGRAAFEAGNFAQALPEFERSNAAVSSPNTKLMIARCHAELGDAARGYAMYTATIDEARALAVAKYEPAAQAAQEERSALAGQVAMLNVTVRGDGGTLSVNGDAVTPDEYAQPIAVNPGAVEVVLTRSDGSTDSRALDVAAGTSADVELDATPPAPPPAMEAYVDEEPPDEDDEARLTDRANIGLVLGGKVGGNIGKPVSEFGASYVLEIEIGYMLPFAHKGLEIFVSGQYTQPKTDGVEGEPDPRLPGESFRYEIEQNVLTATLGALYRIHVGTDAITPYGGLGARLYMLRTRVSGDADGQDFGKNTEDQTDIGLLIMGGVDIALGPGALLAELQFGYAGVDGFILRDTNVGALQLVVGYRAML